MQDLKAKQEDLKAIEVEYLGLQKELQDARDEHEKLQNDIRVHEIKLARAKQLLVGLSGEKDRWLISLEDIEVKLNTIVPDVLLAAATISYLGAFTKKYRKQAVESWLYQMHTDSLITLENYSL